LPSFPRKRGFQQRSWSSILTLLASPLHEKINVDSRFRGNDDLKKGILKKPSMQLFRRH